MKGLFSCPWQRQNASKADNRQKKALDKLPRLIYQALAPPVFAYANVSMARFPADAGGKAYSLI
ncbi:MULTISPECIES: hypothetical protein [Comamonas]|uniref:hypothetical protein n=1 Tax=Comamonas TaxID=283 RepID=UPI00103FE157|nr:hypothetical protein [Comamonas thiooxydans]